VRLKGSPRRGAHPELRIALRQAAGEANIRRAAVTLPRTELLDARNIGGVCSRARFAAATCPRAALVGRARAWSPLLGRPLEGPVYLRSTAHGLPDAVAALDGRFRLDLSARLDAVGGRLRATFGDLPDVPLSKVVLTVGGGRRGLLVNTGGVCARRWEAGGHFSAHNGRQRQSETRVKARCGDAPHRAS
jgi:hypothetical protein